MSAHPVRHPAVAPAPPRGLPGFEHINRYWDRVHHTFVAKILPGEYYVTTRDEAIATVLGSCVAACVRDRSFGIGGMNHFMLPESRGGGDSWIGTGVSAATRYGSFAMEHLINDILKHGGMRKNLEVKVFGGGRILAQMTHVGRHNIDFILEYVRTEGLLLAAQDLGDIHPRKVLYYPLSGRVRVKRLRSLHNDTIVRREQAYLHDLEEKPVAGEVELF